MAGVLVLPALSYTGYRLIHIEYWWGVLLCVALALIFTLLARIRLVGIALLPLVTLFTIALYFSDDLLRHGWLLAFAIAAGAGYVALCVRHFDLALKLTGVAAVAQVITAVVTAPPVNTLKEYDAAGSNRPAVVHLVFDEHGGIGAFPQDIIPAEEIDAMVQGYVSRGFVVFRHAYTIDKATRPSLRRVLALRPGRKHYRSVFDQIGKKWAVDVTHTQYLNLSGALRGKPYVARHQMYNQSIPSDSIASSGLSLEDRAWVMGSLVSNWFRRSVDSPVAKIYLREVPFARRMVKSAARKIHSMVSQYIFAEMSDRLIREGRRGTYYFAHQLFTHSPFVLDRNCNVLPVKQWASGLYRSSGLKRMLKMRRDRYQRHFEQASCAAQSAFRLIDGLMARPDMADTVFLIHSDHGSRLAIRDPKKHKEGVYDKRDYERDMRGSFIALKIPGMEGGIVDQPVRLDYLFNQLVRNDFRSFNLKKLKPKGSPY